MDTITKLDEHSLEFAQTLQTENDFQNFVDSHPEIERSIDLRNNYYHVDRRFYNLKKSGKINKDFSIKYKVRRFNWSEYNTEEDIQKFIDEHNIESTSEFSKEYGGLVRKASRLKIKINEFKYHPKLIDVANKFIKENNITSFKDLEDRFPKKASEFFLVKDDVNYYQQKIKSLPRWSDYNTREDIQKFIDEHNIESSTAFCKMYGGLAKKTSRLGISLSDFKFSNSKLISAANKFLEENQILSFKDLEERFPDKANEFLPVKVRIKYYHLPVNISPWASYNTESEIQEFINSNNIKSRKELHDKYSGLYHKCCKIGVLNLLTFEEDRPIIKYNVRERFKSIDDVYKYLNENNITKSSQLTSTEEGKAIYSFAMKSMGWKLEFIDKPVVYSDYNTKEDFQNFIDTNNVRSPGEFKKINDGIYNRMYRLGLHKQVVYPEPARRSLLEIIVAKELNKNGIKYLEQETFPDLKDKAPLKVDFLIESKKLILEPGGIQHLAPCGFVNEERFRILQKHDEMKRDYFNKKGYIILYLFKNDHPNLFSNEEFNRLVDEYPGECYVVDEIDKFINRIISI